MVLKKILSLMQWLKVVQDYYEGEGAGAAALRAANKAIRSYTKY